jgi:hypothetical protein
MVLPQFLRHASCQGVVTFGVYLGYFSFAVAELHLCSFQPVEAANFGACGLPQPVGRPSWNAGPITSAVDCASVTIYGVALASRKFRMSLPV